MTSGDFFRAVVSAFSFNDLNFWYCWFVKNLSYLLSTHADRQGVDISVTVCLSVFVYLYGYGFLRRGQS